MYNTKNVTDWRKLSVKRERRHEPLVDKLCSNNLSSGSIFPFIKDLMVFAAMVGHSLGKRKSLSGDSISIILETYASDEKDAYIYLISLMEKRDGSILKDENLQSAIKIFEEYCNAGLYEISLWLDENPGDLEGVDTLISKILDKAIRNENFGKKDQPPENIDVDF